MRYQRAEHPLKIDGFGAARDFFAGCFADSDPAREIIRDAAAHGTAGIVLAHNHPSGDARPSASDCRATRRLASVAEAIDCALLDHLVFAGAECTSFRRLGLL